MKNQLNFDGSINYPILMFMAVVIIDSLVVYNSNGNDDDYDDIDIDTSIIMSD